MNIYDGCLMLVNRKHTYKSQPIFLEPVDERFVEVLLKCDVKKKLTRWIRDYHLADTIAAVSGFRTIKEQEHLYQIVVEERGKEYADQYVALSYASEHHTGLAVDLGINLKDIDYVSPDLPDTPELEVFKDNAWKYGFIQRYQKEKENITGISEEPWHYRYVGLPHSYIIMHNDFALEEYVEWIKKYQYKKKPYIIKVLGKLYAVSYQKINSQEELIFDNQYAISGNNVDGFIITEKV